MSNRDKIGVRVDSRLWQQFREDVQQRHGMTRGVLGEELETAIRLYLGHDEAATHRRIEGKLDALLEANDIDVDESINGGGDPPTPDSSDAETRARADRAVPDEKPAANQARNDKIAWLAAQIRGADGTASDVQARDEIVELVKTEYGFRRETCKEYVEAIVEELGYVAHPHNDALLTTPQYRRKILENEAEAEAEEIMNAEPAATDDD